MFFYCAKLPFLCLLEYRGSCFAKTDVDKYEQKTTVENELLYRLQLKKAEEKKEEKVNTGNVAVEAKLVGVVVILLVQVFLSHNSSCFQ